MNNPTPTDPKPQLPAEVREAIKRSPVMLTKREYDDLCAALAPLWPKPTPAPSNAEVAAAVEYAKDKMSFPEKGCVTLPEDYLRTVLAALADAQRDKERLSSLERMMEDGSVHLGTRCDEEVCSYAIAHQGTIHRGDTLRAAIDAAMKEARK